VSSPILPEFFRLFYSRNWSIQSVRDTSDCVPNALDSPSSPKSPFKEEELQEKESSNSASSSPSKDSSSPSPKKIQMPLPPFPYRLKKKDQDYIEKMRETFSQFKINIPLLDAVQYMPPYARFLKELCTIKRVTGVPKKTFLTFGANYILSQIPVKYKDPSCPTVSMVIRDQLIH